MVDIIEAGMAETVALAMAYGFLGSNPILSIIIAVLGTLIVVKEVTRK